MNSCINSLFVYEFMKEFFHGFMYESRTNFCTKIGYVTNGLYCKCQARFHVDQLIVSMHFNSFSMLGVSSVMINFVMPRHQ